MEKFLISLSEIEEWQAEKWETYCSQNGVYLKCNLRGHWQVFLKAEGQGKMSLHEATKLYKDLLRKQGVPEYKQAVEFEF